MNWRNKGKEVFTWHVMCSCVCFLDDVETNKTHTKKFIISKVWDHCAHPNQSGVADYQYNMNTGGMWVVCTHGTTPTQPHPHTAINKNSSNSVRLNASLAHKTLQACGIINHMQHG